MSKTTYPLSFGVAQDGANREHPHRVDYTVTAFVDGVETRKTESHAFFMNDAHADFVIQSWNARGSKPSQVGNRSYVYARRGATAPADQTMRVLLAEIVQEFGHRGAGDDKVLPAHRQPTLIAEAMLFLGMR